MGEYLNKMHKFLTNQPEVFRPRSGFYPSETSHVVTNSYEQPQVVGKCLRQIFWKFKEEVPSNAFGVETERKFILGKAVEEAEINLMQRAGIFIANNVKFKSRYLGVSGEVDVIVELPNMGRVGIELKSIWGYNSAAGCIKATRDKPFFPKLEHLFQVMCYAHHYTNEVPDKFKMKVFKIIYIMRDTGEDGEHTITLDSAGFAIVNGDKTKFNIAGLKTRIESFYQYFEDNQIPPRDYDYKYSKDKVAFLHSKGLLNKVDTEKFKSGRVPEIADFQCRYCPYAQACKEVGGDMRFPDSICEI